jgi:hypothetical protein
VSGSASLFSHFVSTRTTFRWLTGLIVVSAAVLWVTVGFDIAEIRLFERQGQGIATATDRAAHSIVRDRVFLAQAVVLTMTSIAFMTWLYRCRVNLRAFGTRRLRYSRNWAVFGFLVPVLNLIRPYQVAREVWQASDPRVTDPFEWKLVQPPPLFHAWWGTFVLFVLFKVLAVWMASSSVYDPQRLQVAQGVELLADTMAAVSVTLVYFVVERITDAQEAKWRNLAPPPTS